MCRSFCFIKKYYWIPLPAFKTVPKTVASAGCVHETSSTSVEDTSVHLQQRNNLQLIIKS